MKRSILRTAAVGLFAFIVMAPGAAWAGTDIAWFWNSGDHDAKARFRAYGEHIDLCKHNNARVYVQYGVDDGGSVTRTDYDGGIDTCKDIDWSAPDGYRIRLKVCEAKTLAPDDCSGWRYGVA